MLQLSSTLVNQKILSLRTSGQVAVTTEPIINPNNLKVEGIYCIDKFSGERLILVSQDIREHINQGFVVNDHEVLAEAEDLIRLHKVLELKFELIGKTVFTDSKKRIGKVADYAVDDSSMYIQKLYVGQNLLKSLTGGQLSVDRDQIVEITDRKIVIKNPLKGVRESASTAVPSPAA